MSEEISRTEIFDIAREEAKAALDAGMTMRAVSEFMSCLLRARLHPPLHPADQTQGVLLAEAGDIEGVRKWMNKFQG